MKEFDVVKFCDYLKKRANDELKKSFASKDMTGILYAARAIELSMLYDDISSGVFDKEVK